MSQHRLSLLHISDLHLGTQHSFNEEDPAFAAAPRTLHEVILTDLRSEGMIPNFVIVSGDLTSTAGVREFRKANLCLDEIKEYLRPARKNRFIIAPGNHDVSWEIEEDESKYENYLEFKKSWYGKSFAARKTYFGAVFRAAGKDRDLPFDVAFAVFDSCITETRDTPGMGYIGPQFWEVQRHLAKHPPRPGVPYLKIAVLHHHVVPVTMLEKLPDKDRQFSLLRDAAAFLENLIDEGFHLVFHGHQHDPFYGHERRLTPKNGLTTPGILIIGSGTVGSKKDRGSTNRLQYNLVEVEARDSGRGFAVHIRSRYTDPRDPYHRKFIAQDDDIHAYIGDVVPMHQHLEVVKAAAELELRARDIVITDFLRVLVKALQSASKPIPLRACFLELELQQLSLTYHYATVEMEARQDENIELSIWSGCAGRCIIEGEPVRADLTRVTVEELLKDWHLLPEQVEITKDLKCVLSFPAFFDGAPIGVLSIDSTSEEALPVLDSESTLQLARIVAYEIAKIICIGLPQVDEFQG